MECLLAAEKPWSALGVTTLPAQVISAAAAIETGIGQSRCFDRARANTQPQQVAPASMVRRTHLPSRGGPSKKPRAVAPNVTGTFTVVTGIDLTPRGSCPMAPATSIPPDYGVYGRAAPPT